MSTKTFASAADLEVKKVSFDKLSEHAYAYTAEGDPNTGVIIGDDGCMIIDATATPVAAQGVIAKVREITDKPIKYVVLTHYHADHVGGAEEILERFRPRMVLVREGEPPGWLVAAAVSLAAVACALLVASIARTNQQATIVGGVGNILMGAIGGIMVPKFMMPTAMQTLAEFSPMA